MIRIDQELRTPEGVTVYRDEQRNKFFVLPNQPRFRLDDSGKPVFKFIKYRTPIDRPGGKKGGGFVIFDSEFVVPEDKQPKVQQFLDGIVSAESASGNRGPAQIGDFTYTRGTATLQLLDSGTGTLVEKVMSAGKPSLFGHNVCSFTAELSPEGATILEKAMQGSGGVAQVIYDLYFIAKIPPLQGHVWFFAEKFYSFWQQIDKSDDHWWNGNSGEFKDTRREQFRASDSGGVDFEFDWVLPNADDDAKIKNKIRDWGWSAIEDAVKRLTLSDPVANTDTGLPDGVHHVTRDFSTDKTASFDRYIHESDAVEWHVMPQGTLPNITSLAGIRWDDYSTIVDADDPFFKTLRVNLGVNADFKKFGINSVDAWVKYNSATLKPLAKDAGGNEIVPHFTSADQRVAFEQYIANDNWKYTYGYKVNYEDDNRVFDSGAIESDANVLTINVGSLGVIYVEVAPGNIDWSQVTTAEVTLSYEDPANNVPHVEQSVVLNKNSTTFTWRQVILAPRTKPYKYKVKYTMADQSVTVEQTADAPQLFIDDPFYTKAVHLRSLLDFNHDVDTIFIDMTYTDNAHGLQRTQSFALTKTNFFYDWTFPAVVGSSGDVSYSGMIRFQDGHEQPIALTTAKSDTIYIDGATGFLEISIDPILVDWNLVKLVTVRLEYIDRDNNIDEIKDLPIKKDLPAGMWRVPLRNPQKKTFTWSADWYLGDPANTHRQTPPTTTNKTVVVLEVPSA